MKDNEIIKALECCTKGNTSDVCVDCPLRTTDICTEEENGVLKLALDLINRQQADKEALIAGQETMSKYIKEQQAEIERFRKIETTVNGFWEGIQKLAMFKDKETPTLEELLEYMDNLKTEAIKEFAEKIRQKIVVMVCLPDLLTLDDYDKCIDDILKEMMGDTE